MARRFALALPLFAAATFASAFLIFLVQPLVGKRILPWFGGAPSVWTLCLAFYQTTLFAGYAYAHGLMRLARPGAQVAVHAVAVAAALVALPVLPDLAWRPPAGSTAPSAWILAMLAAHVGLPFLVLAATGPLLQAWFARALPGRSPYPLYAVSNLGSMGAVAAYPLWIEPRVGVAATGAAWSQGFVATAAAVLVCAALSWRRSPSVDPAQTARAAAPRARDALLWAALAGSAVMLLMGVTNELCLDVASVPFLWMLPLGVYLLSFVLCFGSARAYDRGVWLAFTAAMLAAPSLLALLDLQGPTLTATPRELLWQGVRLVLLLLGGCMLLHGELHRLRPDPTSLTAYYLCIAGGGALGGLFVGLVTPWLFDDYHERLLAVGVGGLALLVAFAREPDDWLGSRASRARRGSVALLAAAVLVYGAWSALSPAPYVVHGERNFFGLLRVAELPQEDGSVERALYHGTTRHGYERSDRPGEPTAYYGVDTGIGRLFAERDAGERWRVGVVGLGIGTLAAYGRAGDHFSFYEIDPAVVALARSHFGHLGAGAAELEIVEGDGRLLLESQRAAGAPRFDLLVLDAYSGDAVPVHLLTREAVALYADRIASDGLLAFHVSNRFFDLAPLVGRLGAELGLHVLVIDSPHLPQRLSLRSIWVLLSRDAGRLDALARRTEAHWRGLGVPPTQYVIERAGAVAEGPLWTDDYSDLFRVLGRPNFDARIAKQRRISGAGP